MPLYLVPLYSMCMCLNCYARAHEPSVRLVSQSSEIQSVKQKNYYNVYLVYLFIEMYNENDML